MEYKNKTKQNKAQQNQTKLQWCPLVCKLLASDDLYFINKNQDDVLII